MTVATSSALGNSLLSGYGGPGEGSQAILGSALLGGGGAGGGDGSLGWLLGWLFGWLFGVDRVFVD